MPPTVLRRTDGDVTRRYWWVILLLVIVIGAVSLVMMPKGSGPGAGGADGAAGLASEQSLESISDGLNTAGAPGGPINLSMEGTGAYRRHGDDADGGGQKSSLYGSQPSATAAGPTAKVAEAGSSAAAGGSLAEALKKVASSKPMKDDNKGWGSAAVRTGFTPPKASFSGLAGPGGGGGGGSGASLGVGGVAAPFGLGGSNPGSGGTVGLGSAGGGAGGFKVRKGGHNQAFDNLKQVQNVAAKAAGAAGDLANNMGSRSYDGATARAGLPGGAAATGGSVVGGPDAVPENLKLDDPKLQNKKIEVPAIGKDKSADPQADMERQIMMMIMMAAIGGIAGPMFGAVGVGMANMLFNQDMKATYNLAPSPPPTTAPR